MLRKIKQ